MSNTLRRDFLFASNEMKLLKLALIIFAILIALSLVKKAIGLAVSFAFVVGVIAIVLFFLKKNK